MPARKCIRPSNTIRTLATFSSFNISFFNTRAFFVFRFSIVIVPCRSCRLNKAVAVCGCGKESSSTRLQKFEVYYELRVEARYVIHSDIFFKSRASRITYASGHHYLVCSPSGQVAFYSGVHLDYYLFRAWLRAHFFPTHQDVATAAQRRVVGSIL
jgi:hypothetical protein